MKDNSFKNISTFSLTWPIFIETSIRMFFLSMDTVMLSAYSTKAVAAVGLISQLMFFVILFYNLISTGTSIVVTQYVGANKKSEYSYAIAGSINLILVLSIILSVFLTVFSHNIIGLFKLEPEVYHYALDFFKIFSIFSIALALNALFGSIFRSFGFTKIPMIINLIAMLLNAFGNYCFIFGKFGFPVLAVKGVAISSIVSQGIASIILFGLMFKYKIPLNFKSHFKVPKYIYTNILKIGVPTGLESVSYNLAQIIMLNFISRMGTVSLAAYSYAFTIQRIIMVFTLSIGQSTQILSSYFVGAKKSDHAYKLVFKNFFTAFSICIFVSIVVAIFRVNLISLLTHDKAIISLTSTLLLLAIFLESGRTFNMTFIMGLKGSGDVQFPLIMGLISMWGIGVVMSYWLGIVISVGIAGVWIAISSDEWFRGIIMLFRWKSKKWVDKSIISS